MTESETQTQKAEENPKVITLDVLAVTIATILLLVIGTGFGYYLAVTTPQQSTDTNKLSGLDQNITALMNGVGYNIQQDKNILDTIAIESQCTAYLSKCKLLSQDYNSGLQTIQCRMQGG